MTKGHWVWEITYEDTDEGQLGNLPMIHVPDGEQMPRFIMLWEVRNTGEFEPGLSGEEVPIIDYDLRQYAQMETLKAGLSAEDYDKVRLALGLKPLEQAVKDGQQISQKVRDNINAVDLARKGDKPM